ncbi:MBL fold metallo-hydrolase [Exiguobacterium algae]|uniref:MBL fold metallo-hydrolase n=1 Tax=Exiguobacterium algae TaxID=2751250 RepID=UPI001BE6FB13|nr:MBL fold metallo-hydrolase [Exiguobacterium algae]
MKLATHGEVTAVQAHVKRGPFSMNMYVYYIDGMLIDTGTRTMLDELKTFYQSVPIDLVSITHPHEDHIGTAAWLEQQYGMPIYIRESAIDLCSQGLDIPKYRALFSGSPETFRPIGYEQDTVQSEHHTYQVIHTPGHEPHHVVLYDQQHGRLFSGDLFVYPYPKVMIPEESVPEQIRSLRRVLALDFEEVYCQHAGYLKDGRVELTKKLDYLEHLTDQVQDAVRKGDSVDEINRRLFPEPSPLVRISNGDYDSRHMIRSILTESSNHVR